MNIIVLQRVKYPHNLAAAIRAAACFDVGIVLWTGSRFAFNDGDRLPREERMKGYRNVQVVATERPFDWIRSNWQPFEPPSIVCVELTPSAAPLTSFQHPDEEAVYVFGPEDGHVSQAFRSWCHQFVYIPARHCLNLAASINVVLAHRAMQQGSVIKPAQTEGRGIIEVAGWEGK